MLEMCCCNEEAWMKLVTIYQERSSWIGELFKKNNKDIRIQSRSWSLKQRAHWGDKRHPGLTPCPRWIEYHIFTWTRQGGVKRSEAGALFLKTSFFAGSRASYQELQYHFVPNCALHEPKGGFYRKLQRGPGKATLYNPKSTCSMADAMR